MYTFPQYPDKDINKDASGRNVGGFQRLPVNELTDFQTQPEPNLEEKKLTPPIPVI